MRNKLLMAALLLASALPAVVSAGFIDDTANELPEPSTIGLFVAAAIAITVLAKLKK